MPSPRSRRAAKLSSLSTGRVGAESDDAAALAVLAGIDDWGEPAGADRKPGGLDVERADALAAAATRSTVGVERLPASARRSARWADSLVNLARTRSRASPRVQLSSPATSVAPRRPFAIDSA